MSYREIGYTFDDGSRVIESTMTHVLVLRNEPFGGAWYEVCDHDGFYGVCYWDLSTAIRMLHERDSVDPEMTYTIASVGDGDWWIVLDSTGEPHGGRFYSHAEAETYAEGNIEMLERIQREAA